MAHAAGGRSAPPGRSRPLAVAVLVTGVLVALSLVVAVAWRARSQGEGRASFEVDATVAQQLVVERLQLATGMLQETRGLAEAGDDLTAEQFEQGVAAAIPDRLGSLATVVLVEEVARGDLDAFVAERRAAGLPEFDVRSVAAGGAAPALATFEASTRGAPILQGHDLRADPAIARGLRDAAGGGVHLTSRLQALPRSVLRVHPDLGRSAFALVSRAGADGWVVALLSGDELAAQAAAVDEELDVVLSAGDDVLGASSTGSDGSVPDLFALPPGLRATLPVEAAGGPLLVTAADVDGLGGGSWREPGLLLGAGIALSILVGSLVLVLARGRAGALAVASQAQLAQARSEQSFRAVVQNLSDLVVVTDGDRRVDFVAPSVTRLLGRDPSVVRGRMLEDLVHPQDRALLTALSAPAGVSEKGLIRVRHSDGEYRSFDVVVANRLDDPAIGGLVLTGHDVTDRVQQADRLSHDATHDALTGLPNRALLQDRLQHALVRAERTGGKVAVVFGDLDDFKLVNDRYGHLAGDELLKAVARRLRSAARAMDTVGRYAGDEFVIVCEELDGQEGARLVAERLHAAATRPVDVGEAVVDVRVSLGVAMAGPGEKAASVIDRADQAMYRAKAARTVVFAA